jgi:flagellar basal-body rod protein FlgB
MSAAARILNLSLDPNVDFRAGIEVALCYESCLEPRKERDIMTIFDRTMQLLQRSLDLRSARQRVISSNLANEETPGYRASELNFMDQLRSAHQGRLPVVLAATQPRHFGLHGAQGVQVVTGKLSEVPAGDLPLDANSVNLELEMAKLSDNAMQYNTAASILAKKFHGLLNVIREGR